MTVGFDLLGVEVFDHDAWRFAQFGLTPLLAYSLTAQNVPSTGSTLVKL